MEREMRDVTRKVIHNFVKYYPADKDIPEIMAKVNGESLDSTVMGVEFERERKAIAAKYAAKAEIGKSAFKKAPMFKSLDEFLSSAMVGGMKSLVLLGNATVVHRVVDAWSKSSKGRTSLDVSLVPLMQRT